MDKTMTDQQLAQLRGLLWTFQQDVATWRKRNFPKDGPTVGVCVLAEEVGELAHCIVKRHQGIRLETATPAMEEDAFGDVLISLAALADQAGVHLGTAVEDTWFRVRERDWRPEQSDVEDEPPHN